MLTHSEEPAMYSGHSQGTDCLKKTWSWENMQPAILGETMGKQFDIGQNQKLPSAVHFSFFSWFMPKSRWH